MSELFDIVEAHYPHDPWGPSPQGFARLSSRGKAAAAAERIAAGAPSAGDLAALDALAASPALRVFGWTARELLLWFGEPEPTSEQIEELRAAVALEEAEEARARHR